MPSHRERNLLIDRRSAQQYVVVVKNLYIVVTSFFRQGITANEVMRHEKERRRHIMDIAYSTRCLVIQANKIFIYSYRSQKSTSNIYRIRVFSLAQKSRYKCF